MDISKYLVKMDTFERMQNYGDYDCPSFEEFQAWNLQCIADLDAEDRVWITGLCKRISKRALKLMDEETCSAHTAYWFYFDKDKNVCIVNPR